MGEKLLDVLFVGGGLHLAGDFEQPGDVRVGRTLSCQLDRQYFELAADLQNL